MDLESLVDSLAPRLLRYCLGHTGNRALAEEAAQDALTALVGRWRRQGPPESPEAFVFAIARRRAHRAGFKQRLLQPLVIFNSSDDDESISIDVSDRKHDPEQRAEQRSELRRIVSALKRLRGSDREALLLTAVGELTVEGAATSLGITPSAFKMRLHRARRRLESELEGMDNLRAVTPASSPSNSALETDR